MFVLDRLPLDTSNQLSIGLSDDDAWVRLRAAVGLANRGDRRGLDVLLSMVDSDDYDAALQAVGGLGALGEEDVLVRVVIDPGMGTHLREVAIAGLSSSETIEAARALDQAAEDPNRFVRRAARRAREERTS